MKKVTTAEKAQVKRLIKMCIRLLKKKQYELDLPKNAADIALDVLEVKKPESPTATASKQSTVTYAATWLTQ